jgi:hypothetical protein
MLNSYKENDMPFKDPEKRRQYNKEYAERTKQKRKDKWKEIKSDPELLEEARLKNKESCKRYREKYPERRKESVKKWVNVNQRKNQDNTNAWKNAYRATPKGNIDHRMGNGIRKSLSVGKSGRKWEDLVGYSVDDLKLHLESLFTDGMTWEAFLNGEIHIDHIRPKSSFTYETPDDPEFKECWAIKNLQPLWAIDNLSKGDKF